MHKSADVEKIIQTSTVFHNLLLEEDGMDMSWEEGISWKDADYYFSQFDHPFPALADMPLTSVEALKKVIEEYGVPEVALPSHVVLFGEEEREIDHFLLRDKLVTHFAVLHAAGKIVWPKRAATDG